MWDEQIRFHSQISVYHESGDYIIHNYKINSWIVLDRDRYNSIAAPLQYKKLTPAQVSASYAKRTGISLKEAREQVGKVLLLLWANKIADHPRAPRTISDQPPLKRVAPKIVYFVTTYKCNLSCAYCYAESSPEVQTTGDLTTDEAKDVIDQIADLGTLVLAFTGGEALLRKDCIDLMEHAKKKGLIVILITNGSPVTPEKAQRMAPLLSGVTVSMDSPTPGRGHDQVRGKYSWLRAKKAIDLFQQAGVPVAVNTTVTAASIEALPDMMRWVLDQKIGIHRIGSVSDLGRGGENNLAATTPDLLSAERKAHQVLVERLDEVPLDRLKFLHNPSPRNTTKRHCGVGVEEISIDSLGEVYPCKLLHEPRFAAGNIRERSLREIWESSPVMNAMVEAGPGNLPACENCTFINNCGGGCRAHQYSMTGDLHGTFTRECPMLRRSLRRHMWLHWKQFEGRNRQAPGAVSDPVLPESRSEKVGGQVEEQAPC